MKAKGSQVNNSYTGKMRKRKNRLLPILIVLFAIILIIVLCLSLKPSGKLLTFLVLGAGGCIGFTLLTSYAAKKPAQRKKAGNTAVVKSTIGHSAEYSGAVRPSKRNFNWVIDKQDQNLEEAEAVENILKQQEENRKDTFVPYRSPFDPIKPQEEKEEQDQEQSFDESYIEAAVAAVEDSPALEESVNFADISENTFEEDTEDSSEVTYSPGVIPLFRRAETVSEKIRPVHAQRCDDEPPKQDFEERAAALIDFGKRASNIWTVNKPEKKNVLYIHPSTEMLIKSEVVDGEVSKRLDSRSNAQKLIDTLTSFGVGARVMNISEGPSVTRYEIQPNVGVKVSKIVSLADDIALNLAATGVRIEAPIPGKAAIGIEVPNKQVTPVLLRDVLESEEFTNHPSKLSFAIGKDIAGNTIAADIARMPHLLIAGATGSGKSVCINTLIVSILYKASPSEVKLLMVDPKVVELGIYNGIPHLLIPVVTDPKKAAGALNWAVQEMTGRYKLFADNNVRDLAGYNRLVRERGDENTLPQIVIIIDELADLMMVAPNDVEDCICRLAQMARAAGMHLVIATQRPSVDVITGVIKANIPSRISFAVSSQIDSRTILDMAGAEKLLGRGDMLFYPLGAHKPIRVQGSFVSDKEVETVVSHVKAEAAAEYDEDILQKIDRQTEQPQIDTKGDDELLPQAIELVLELGQASTSMVQRKFKVGYSRAARILDQMEAWGVISGPDGSKPRQVLITKQEWDELNS